LVKPVEIRWNAYEEYWRLLGHINDWKALSERLIVDLVVRLSEFADGFPDIWVTVSNGRCISLLVLLKRRMICRVQGAESILRYIHGHFAAAQLFEHLKSGHTCPM
jgi:hypothetical protein